MKERFTARVSHTGKRCMKNIHVLWKNRQNIEEEPITFGKS